MNAYRIFLIITLSIIHLHSSSYSMNNENNEYKILPSTIQCVKFLTFLNFLIPQTESFIPQPAVLSFQEMYKNNLCNNLYNLYTQDTYTQDFTFSFLNNNQQIPQEALDLYASLCSNYASNPSADNTFIYHTPKEYADIYSETLCQTREITFYTLLITNPIEQNNVFAKDSTDWRKYLITEATTYSDNILEFNNKIREFYIEILNTQEQKNYIKNLWRILFEQTFIEKNNEFYNEFAKYLKEDLLTKTCTIDLK